MRGRGADLSAAAGQAAYKRLEEARAQAAVYLQKTKMLKVEVSITEQYRICCT
jgi:hypothetical protein